MHVADPKTPVSIVEYAPRPNQLIIETRLDNLVETLRAQTVSGPHLHYSVCLYEKPRCR